MKKQFAILVLAVFILALAPVSALLDVKLDFTKELPFTLDTKIIEYNPIWEEYEPIEIKTLLGLGETIFSGAIVEHTNTCGENCLSTMEIYLANDGVLIENIIFKTLQDNGDWINQNIRSYQFQYWGAIDDYEIQCHDGEPIVLENGTHIPQICEQVKIGTHEDWINYQVGNELPSGEYTLKLTGEKKPSRTVDWIIETNGKWLDEWATWGNISEGDDAEVILNSPVDTSTTFVNEVQFNASANVTGGSDLVNMSLWTNETGSWVGYNETLLVGESIGRDTTLSADTLQGSLPTNQKLGIEIDVGASDVTLTAVTKFAGGTDTHAYLQYTNTTIIASAIFSGTNATFNNVLSSGQTYYITTGNPSSTFSIQRDDSQSFPVSMTEVTMVNGIQGTAFPYTVDNSRAWAINLLYFQTSFPTSSTQTWNRTITDDIIWNVQSCDSDGDCGFAPSNFTLFLDSTPPTITISSPESIIDTHVIGNELLLNTTITDTNLDTCWYYYNNTNTTFSCTSGVLSSEGFNTVLGEQSITVWANDSVGNIDSSTTSWMYNFVENSATYDATSYETSTEILTLNFTTGITVQSISANLIYNDTSYLSTSSCDGSICILNNSIDIPILTGGAINNTFYWEFTIFNGTSSNTYNSTSRTQEINPIILIECNATYTTKALNFTVYDEGNLSKLEPFEFGGAFKYWLGSGSTYKSYYLTDTSTNETDLCINPTDENYKINSSIEYDSSALGVTYTKRNYYFNDYQINSSLQNISLLLLDSEDSTSFIQEVLEEQIGVEDAYIYTYRYYPGEDDYRITQITKTDNGGTTIGFYEAETANYKHSIFVDNVLRLEEEEGYKIIPSSTPYTITFYLGSEVETPGEVYDDETGLSKSLSFSSTTNIVTYSYTDTNSSNEGGRLLVLQEKYAIDDVIVSNSTSSLSSAILTSDISNYSGNFIAQAFVTRNGIEYLVDSIRFTIDEKIDTFGEVGVLLAWFIILVACMAFLYDAVIGLIAVNLSIIFVNLIGFVSFGLTYIFGILLVSITIIWLMKK